MPAEAGADLFGAVIRFVRSIALFSRRSRLHDDHPAHAEAVGNHAEPREERLGERHCTCPPSASAANMRSASASLGFVLDIDR